MNRYFVVFVSVDCVTPLFTFKNFNEHEIEKQLNTSVLFISQKLKTDQLSHRFLIQQLVAKLIIKTKSSVQR
ncbi:Uncharacterized protein APZ42_024034 [Daphnia magna]|uniref:Uncharacterized protein n=1 Tax=Daphnia magna TaxID=35525 RepID=A0A164UE63_9CRUS|nr:Uncharacterized protein APZ42_024034 [Daphnia magna]